MFQKKSAFTLIELLVVIVIIGILATIGVAQFNGYQEKARFAKAQAFAAQADTALRAAAVVNGNGFPLRLDFDEGSGTTSQDTSGSGNDLNWGSSGFTWEEDVFGLSGSSLKLTNRRIDLLDVVNMPREEVTFSLWVNLAVLPDDYNHPILLSNGLGGIFIYGSGALEFVLPESNKLRVESVIVPGKWYHILASYRDGQARLYLDGMLVSQMDNINFSALSSTGNVIHLGRDESGQLFNGLLDRVRIYPVGLDPNNL
jgi:prepilin-type N-terminal cleavage/methylation domain-containing protein